MENKPDFESMLKKNAFKIHPLDTEKASVSIDHADWCLERVWNTHVVPLESENKALSDWKESALAVFAEWDRVSDYIKPRCRLGDKYSSRALELFKMIDAENKALREEINALNGDIQLYRNGHEVNAKRYNDLLIERNKLAEEIERLEAEVLKEKFPEN